MKISHLVESRKALLEQHLAESRVLLSESCVGLDKQQKQIVEGIYKEFLPLIEASLSPQQVTQVFGAVEKAATDAGSNRTMIGQGVDTVKKANEIIDNAGKWLQNTKPVQAFDQKFEQLKNKINTKFPDSKLLDGISHMGIWAKENPGKTAAIIGILTAIAGLAAGPVGGAIAGQVLRGSVELLKGEKLSTAIGKGIKTAALGFISAKAFELIGSAISGGFKAAADATFPGAVKMDYSRIINEIGGEFGDRFANFELKGLYGQPGDVKDIVGAANEAANAWKAGDYDLAKELWRQAKDAAEVIASPEYVAELTADQEKRNMILSGAKGAVELFNVLGSVSQGAAAASGMQPKKESIVYQSRPLSEGQVYLVFNSVLSEGIWDKVKAGAGAVAQKVATTGHNLTTKVTADKLNSAWTKAGSPTDTDELAKFLQSQGIDDAVIAQVYKTMKLPPPGQGGASGTGSAYSQVKQSLSGLDKKSKRRLQQYLQKQLGTA